MRLLNSLFVLFALTYLYAQGNSFHFDINRIDINTLYIYDFSSNKEEYQPTSKRYYYIKALNEIEEGYFNNETYSILNEITFNWENMMVQKFYLHIISREDVISKIIKPIFTKELVFTINVTKKLMNIKYTDMTEEGFKDFHLMYRFREIPTFFYRMTTGLDTWMALRFFSPDEGKSTMINELYNGYNIKVEIRYLRKEKVSVPYGDVLCYKFELTPKGFFGRLFGKKAWVWLSAEDETHYMVKYINNNARSTYIPKVEFRLVERKSMSLEEWEALKDQYR